jgi:stage II sporulation protein B
MNNAKMTFRFNHGHGRGGNPERTAAEQQVIPLHQEEYQVIEDKRIPQILPQAQIDEIAVPTPSTEVHKQPASFIDAQTLNSYTNDFGSWQSSFDTETLRVEKLIRESDSQTFHSKTGYFDDSTQVTERRSSVQQEFNEPLRDHHWYVPEETAFVRKQRDASWIKVALSVAGAVGTGVAFGFLVLSMFSGDTSGTKGTPANSTPTSAMAITSPNPVSTDKSNASGAAVTAPIAKATGDKLSTADPTASVPVSAAAGGSAVMVVTIPSKTVTFLQSGIFSTPQGANAAQSELTKKGLAAISDTGEKFPVYVGMTLKREEAVILAQQYQQKKIEVIYKNIELPALSKIKWNAKPSDALPSYIAQGDKLLQLISPLAFTHLSEAKPTALDNTSLQSVKSAHQAWKGQTAGVNEGLSEDSKGAVQKMNTAMNAAVVSLDEYKKNNSPSVLWQTQNAMMQYVLAQKELRKTIAAP